MKNSSVDLSEIVAAPLIMRSDPWAERNDRGRSIKESAETILPERERWSSCWVWKNAEPSSKSCGARCSIPSEN